ncbi:RNA 2'-phosphotransferase [Nostoc sp. NMS9]|jgi:putative RNA 2'-phosphotransferase|uniref:RNA 2'-phosphotransferase n=1 Tax=Nostoc sp. NMS9 TaxID=2815393 RepID=UPI0025F7D26B|nr:RNA 2'-phosphotransferase [Nostoc sp. NMS9]MBN3941581.1 RNA 2'-phosphotransferase [Nostoc sp. NMS9]
MKINFSSLSRVISHALRHEPWLYGLEIDEEGWVSVANLLSSLRSQQSEWEKLDENDLVMMINRASKRRHEMQDGKIRALYGHSFPGKLVRRQAEPPQVLYHGTAMDIVLVIRAEGLKPMTRQQVHLSTDRKQAELAAKRKTVNPVILEILAVEAYHKGVIFYEGNGIIWLCDYIPPKFIAV